MKKIFIVYGHYNDASFNAAIKKTFIETAEEQSHEIDCVDLYKEKFDPVFSGEEPDTVVIDHRKRIEKSDIIVLIAPIWNFRMPAIVETTATLVGLAFAIPIRAKTTLIPNPQAAEIAKINPE